MTRGKTFLTVGVGCIAVGIAAGAIVSTKYWGYPFARPPIAEVATATRVLSVTALRADKHGPRCTLEADAIPDLRQHVAEQRKYVDEFPDLRAVTGFADRGMLPAEARAPAWLDPATLYEAVVAEGVLVDGEPGYDTARCFGGYAIEFNLPSAESRLLLTASGPEVSNDHHPYYEILFRREGQRLIAERKSVSFFDIAGIEGFEWPLLHGVFVVLCALAAGVAITVFAIAKGVARWIQRRSPTMGLS